MRIAAIDIGTNSIHMIVVQVRPDLSFEVVDREKDMVRLGAGGLDGRSLTPTAMTSALQTLAKFKRLAESHKVDEIIAAATSATREADNGGDFIARSRARRPASASRSSPGRRRHGSSTWLPLTASTSARRHGGGRRHRRRQRRGHARHGDSTSRSGRASRPASSGSPSAS